MFLENPIRLNCFFGRFLGVYVFFLGTPLPLDLLILKFSHIRLISKWIKKSSNQFFWSIMVRILAKLKISVYWKSINWNFRSGFSWTEKSVVVFQESWRLRCHSHWWCRLPQQVSPLRLDLLWNMSLYALLWNMSLCAYSTSLVKGKVMDFQRLIWVEMKRTHHIMLIYN